jgi:hypothetical protein
MRIRSSKSFTLRIIHNGRVGCIVDNKNEIDAIISLKDVEMLKNAPNSEFYDKCYNFVYTWD